MKAYKHTVILEDMYSDKSPFYPREDHGLFPVTAGNIRRVSTAVESRHAINSQRSATLSIIRATWLPISISHQRREKEIEHRLL